MVIRTKRLRRTYTGYAIGCAAVWAAILIGTGVTADERTKKTFRLTFLAWAMGWASATIARSVYAPPMKWRHQAKAEPQQ